MAQELAGKVALVTGGSRSLGAAIAKRLARDGVAVAITYSTSPDKAKQVVTAIGSAGGRALAIPADAADAPAVKASVATTVQALGRLDILINNAGIAILKPIDDLSLDDFDRTVWWRSMSGACSWRPRRRCAIWAQAAASSILAASTAPPSHSAVARCMS